ncbi:MAG TPA: sigma-70 family RNA polymerase sigma factor [Thermoanaerobaculia bacterium]
MTTPITRLLLQWSDGDAAALDALVPLIADELHKLARAHLRHERPDHTLEAGALVNEVYLRLVDQRKVSWRDRAHFFAASATLMRRILVDYARRKGSQKRGGDAVRVTLSDVSATSAEPDLDVLVLDAALEKLAELDAQQSRIVELRFFAGLDLEAIAEELQVSTSTVSRDWAMARAWLRRAMVEGVR